MGRARDLLVFVVVASCGPRFALWLSASSCAVHATASGAGLYVYGEAGSNHCPANALRIDVLGACESAAIIAGAVWGDTFTELTSPRGCVLDVTAGVVYLNDDDTGGSGDVIKYLLCAVVTGAPFHLTRRKSIPSRHEHKYAQTHRQSWMRP